MTPPGRRFVITVRVVIDRATPDQEGPNGLTRPLTIVADDYGIGPETSRAIREMAVEGGLGATVMLVNSPHAAEAVARWLEARPECDLGWHPNLTLDRPVCDPAEVPSLVDRRGNFRSLGAFLSRMLTGRIRHDDVCREFAAQYRRFVELTGGPPPVVNSHQHVSIFPPCDRALLDVLAANGAKPYIRRVVEPWGTLRRVPGARLKRAFLNLFGVRATRQLVAGGYPGCGTLAGVTDPVHLKDPDFWPRWISRLDGAGDVEICCHPGYEDPTLLGRDCDGQAGLDRRPDETRLLRSAEFRSALDRAGFKPVRPSSFQ